MIENATCTVLEYAYGRYIVAMWHHTLMLYYQIDLQLLFIRYVIFSSTYLWQTLLHTKSNKVWHILCLYMQNIIPVIPKCCPSSLAEIMRKCWDANPDNRPEMEEVVIMLKAIDTSKGKGMKTLYGPLGCLLFCRWGS